MREALVGWSVALLVAASFGAPGAAGSVLDECAVVYYSFTDEIGGREDICPGETVGPLPGAPGDGGGGGGDGPGSDIPGLPGSLITTRSCDEYGFHFTVVGTLKPYACASADWGIGSIPPGGGGSSGGSSGDDGSGSSETAGSSGSGGSGSSGDGQGSSSGGSGGVSPGLDLERCADDGRGYVLIWQETAAGACATVEVKGPYIDSLDPDLVIDLESCEVPDHQGNGRSAIDPVVGAWGGGVAFCVAPVLEIGGASLPGGGEGPGDPPGGLPTVDLTPCEPEAVDPEVRWGETYVAFCLAAGFD
ncbi:MAG: hypothetical protein R3185_00015 [Candidatus Thermoplasmatota archaeon]|nr:hypothetical protein [Candidatus Thermoplasmatota archaeon]